MGWSSAVKKPAVAEPVVAPPELAVIDWNRVVTLDFETYYDQNYTLKKLSTSEYIRDERFKPQMVGIKIGRKKTRIVSGEARIRLALAAINWATHDLLCHNTAFDAFILSHHYGIKPRRYYDTLSMARGLHSNEIGAGLNEVSIFYGGEGKIDGVLETTAGVRNWSASLVKAVAPYCERDVDETFRIFEAMAAKFPAKEMDLINMTIRMFCSPVLRLDVPRAQAEYDREVQLRRDTLLDSVPNIERFDQWDGKKYLGVLDKKSGRDDLKGDDRKIAVAKKVLGSNEKFVQLLQEAGVPKESIPLKVSPAWMALKGQEREANIDKKWTYAFSKDDLKFIDLPEDVWQFSGLNPEKSGDILRAVAIQETLRHLISARLTVKSTSNITRAGRFIEAGRDGMKLPVGYSYHRAHTGRWGGNNKMNFQNLRRGGELRQAILAAKGHALAVCDSGQIEARVNGWLWGQEDLMEDFRKSDAYSAEVQDIPKDKRRPMLESERDAYCKFGDAVYGRVIWKSDELERFISKTAVLGLGFKMGAPKLQMTLAKGAGGGPRVNLPLMQCQEIVSIYRSKNYKIAQGWKTCGQIIEDMAVGASGSHKCLTWGGDGDGNGWILLPNGLSLKYPRLKREMGEQGYPEWTYMSGDSRKKIYDGLLCENIVQALARIIVAEQMLMIDAKHPVVMTTHDEAVAHPKLREAEKCYRFMLKCMTTPLPWCPDIPLAAEGGWAENYSK